MRLRTGSIEMDWKSRHIMAGVEKPIFNPREPSSLAQVAVSPLTGAGNLWLWIPQVRVEQDLTFGSHAGLRARMGVVETREVGPYDTTALPPGVEAARPGLEGRFEFYHKPDERSNLEIAPGFHTSTTHASGFSIPSNLFSLDWLFNPVARRGIHRGFLQWTERRQSRHRRHQPGVCHIQSALPGPSTALVFGDKSQFTRCGAWMCMSLPAGRTMD